jgi:hypothetical protein
MQEVKSLHERIVQHDVFRRLPVVDIEDQDLAQASGAFIAQQRASKLQSIGPTAPIRVMGRLRASAVTLGLLVRIEMNMCCLPVGLPIPFSASRTV